ncbi:hypothetical protein D3C87_1605940 [compost metagenome]
MADEGLVIIQEQGGPRDRKLYAITPRGEEALRAWLEDPSEYLPPPRNEMLLKLFFGRHVPPEHSLARIQRHAERLRATQVVYEAIAKELAAPSAEDDNQAFWLSTLRHGQTLLEGSLRWCEEVEHLIGTRREAAQDTTKG